MSETHNELKWNIDKERVAAIYESEKGLSKQTLETRLLFHMNSIHVSIFARILFEEFMLVLGKKKIHNKTTILCEHAHTNTHIVFFYSRHIYSNNEI